MKLPSNGTYQQWIIFTDLYQRIQHTLVACDPVIMASYLQEMHVCLRFSPNAAKKQANEQGLNNSDHLQVFNNKNVNGICNVVRKPDSKNANKMFDRGQQVSVMAQKNLKLTALLFHYKLQASIQNVTWLNHRSLRVAFIKTVLTVYLDTLLAYVIVASASVMWHPATSLAFCLKSSIFMSNMMWHCTNWWLMGTDFPSGKTLNTTLTFFISLDMASAHKVLPVLASRG